MPCVVSRDDQPDATTNVLHPAGKQFAPVERNFSLLDRLGIPCFVAAADTSQSSPVILYANDLFLEFCVQPGAEVIGQSLLAVDGRVPSTVIVADLGACLLRQRPIHNQGVSYRGGGDVHLVSWTVSQIKLKADEKETFIVLLFDVTEASRRGQAIAFNRDPLTGLLHLHEFSQVMQTRIAEIEAAGGPSPIICYVEIDEFFQLAAVLNNREMDELVTGFAVLLNRLAGAGMAGQAGQDRFVLMTDNFLLLEELPSVLGGPFCIAGKRIHLRLTIGAALFPVDGVTSEDLLRAAVFAAAEGREKGGNCLSLYFNGLAERHRRSRQLEDELGDAVANRQFTLAYQPRVCLATNKVVGAEVLLRWTHPVLGPVSPAEFVPLLERSGRMAAVTNWICTTAMAQQALWRKQGLDIAISINASRPDLEEGAAPLLRCLLDLVRIHGIRPEAVEIEITESVVGSASVRLGVETLTQAGFAIAIDDYGRQQSNLFALTAYPVTTIKLDRDIVKGCASDRRTAIILRHTAQMARDLGFRTVAEGVEDLATLAVVRTAAFDQVQGYVFAKPMAPDGFVRYAASLAGVPVS